MSKKPTVISDPVEDAGGPHWLSSARTSTDIGAELSDIRARNRAKWLADQETRRERSLGRLTSDQQNWLAVAHAHLQRLFAAREVSAPNKRAFCIFEAGEFYVQFLAYREADELLCEAVSEHFVRLTSHSKSALRRLKFTSPPRLSSNYSQKIRIQCADDLDVAVRLAFRVFTQAYKVSSLGVATFRENLPSAPVCSLGFSLSGESKEIEILCQRAYGVDRIYSDSTDLLDAERTTEATLAESIETLMPRIIATILRQFGEPTTVRAGLMSRSHVLSLIDAARSRMLKILEKNESLKETRIVIKATELGLAPRPSKFKAGLWLATCPGIENHEIELLPKTNVFRCDHCRAEGGTEAMEEFAAQTKMNL